MKNLMVFTFLFVSSLAYAEVAKVTGTNCATKKIEIAGSGILFNEKGQQYLITSEHVGVQDSKLCYAANLTQAESTKLILVSSDWEAGLALFKVNQPFANVTTTLNSFQSLPEDSQGVILSTEGFPSAEKSAVSDQTRVLTMKSDRGAFVNSSTNMEIIGARNEHGMSGGAIMQQSLIRGVLSHQRLIAVGGAPSKLSSDRPSSKSDVEIAAMAIPASRARVWADQAITKPVAPTYSRESGDKVKGPGFELRQKFNKNLEKQRKELRVGGDGVGIGGDPELDAVTIELSFQNLAELNAADANLPEVKWLRQISKLLLQQPVVKISSLVMFDQSGDLNVVNVTSTVDFIKKIRTGYAFPIIEDVMAEKIATGKTNPELEAALNFQTDSVEVASLLEKLRALKLLKTQYPQLRVPKNYTDSLLKNAGWAAFSASDFETSVLAMRFLQSQ